MQSPNGLLEVVACKIGVKGHPLLPIVFGHIERFGGSGACLVGITIQILTYDDDILLISDSLGGLQRHLNTIKVFSMDKGFSINMNKAIVMVFNTTKAW